MWRLFYPLRYFALINSEKRHLDLWPTLIVTVIISAPFIGLSGASFFHPGGFLDRVLLLTAALSGFYVAALVAAATFSHPDMDKVITMGPVQIRTTGPDRQPAIEHLTRRDLTTAIFGYLAFNAVMLSVWSALFVSLSSADLAPLSHIRWIGPAFTRLHLAYWRDGFVVLFSAATAHLIVATCLGLYYLMGRMYRRDPKIVTKKPHKEAA